MPSIYINDIKLPDILIPEQNDFIRDMYQFAKDSGEDQYVTMEIPGFSPEDIYGAYIHHCGCIGVITYEVYGKLQQIMLALWAKYPAHIQCRNSITEKASRYIIDNHVHDIDRENAHVQEILSPFEYVIKENADEEIEFAPENARYLIEFIDKIYIDKLNALLKIDNELVLVNDGDKFKIERASFKGRTIISNSAEFRAAIINNPRDLFIHSDINIPITDILHDAKLTCDINEPNCHVRPEDFATWIIGPGCKKLINIFQNYPYEPHIYNWDVSHLIDCSYMFENSGVRDLSMMHFPKLNSAVYMFCDCINLIKPPHFYKVSLADGMFKCCMRLESIDEYFDTVYLTKCYSMFYSCSLLTHAMNGKTFNNDFSSLKMFKNCASLKSAFCNCDMPRGKYIFRETFVNCISLRDVFTGTCLYEKVIFKRCFINCPAKTKIKRN